MRYYLIEPFDLHTFPADGSQDEFITEEMRPITDAEADAIRSALAHAQSAAHQASLTYAQKRAAEYPPMADYLDGVVKGDQAQIDGYVSACLAVKAKYPKPTA